jgi:hypothetical protein
MACFRRDCALMDGSGCVQLTVIAVAQVFRRIAA